MEWAQPLTKHVLRDWDLLRSTLGIGITETTIYIHEGRPISLQHKVAEPVPSPQHEVAEPRSSLQHIATEPNHSPQQEATTPDPSLHHGAAESRYCNRRQPDPVFHHRYRIGYIEKHGRRNHIPRSKKNFYNSLKRRLLSLTLHSSIR